MLIEFRVTNFRSIRETQALNMAASADQSHLDSNCAPSGLEGLPFLTRSAVLYGPNASGKSNLIMALGFMRHVVKNSANFAEGQKIPTAAFCFNSAWADKPSEFELTFVKDGIRYQYSFQLNQQRITHEVLLVYPGRKPQRWFERSYDADKGQYEWHFGTYFTNKNQQKTWQDSTRANSLFLSMAVHLNSEELRPIFNWFVNDIVIGSDTNRLFFNSTIEFIKNDDNKNLVLDLLKAADFRISDLKVKMRKAQHINMKFEAGKPFVPVMEEIEMPDVAFFHLDNHGNPMPLQFDQESKGTQRAFSYAGPIFDVLKYGKILIIDEFDSSLHPQLVRFFIKWLHDPKNKSGAQLFFSTHNTTFLDTDLFRRDQIWFIEKDNEQVSRLYPLTDFSPRKEEALEKGYLMGRYGALPIFRDIDF